MLPRELVSRHVIKNSGERFKKFCTELQRVVGLVAGHVITCFALPLVFINLATTTGRDLASRVRGQLAILLVHYSLVPRPERSWYYPYIFLHQYVIIPTSF